MENHHTVVILEISAGDLVWKFWNKINKNGTRFQNCIYSTSKPGLSKLPKSTCFRLLDAVSPAVPRTAERFQGRVWSRRPATVLQLKRKSRNIQEQDLGCFFKSWINGIFLDLECVLSWIDDFGFGKRQKIRVFAFAICFRECTCTGSSVKYVRWPQSWRAAVLDQSSLPRLCHIPGCAKQVAGKF